MITTANLRALSQKRLKEAKVLYENGLYDGAVYLAGYAIETALKAKICRNLKIPAYPDEGSTKSIFASHDFTRLALLAGLSSTLTAAHPDLGVNWSIVASWNPDWRYRPVGSVSQIDANDFIDAVESSPSGIMTWIKARW